MKNGKMQSMSLVGPYLFRGRGLGPHLYAFEQKNLHIKILNSSTINNQQCSNAHMLKNFVMQQQQQQQHQHQRGMTIIIGVANLSRR
jgi:hypothetical protein